MHFGRTLDQRDAGAERRQEERIPPQPRRRVDDRRCLPLGETCGPWQRLPAPAAEAMAVPDRPEETMKNGFALMLSRR